MQRRTTSRLERQLQLEIDMMEITHPGMDEYQYDLDPIEHDPWELTSYLTTLHDDYTRQRKVQRDLAGYLQQAVQAENLG